MTMRSKQWYTKASRLPNSFAKVSIGIPAHAGGGCLPRHQESADGAADFSSSAEPHPDPHFSLRAGLPSAGRNRAQLLAGRREDILGNHSRYNPNPSGIL